MSDKIQVDYQKLQDISNQFKTESETIQQILSSTRSKADGLVDSGWIGAGADAFHSELQTQLLPGLKRLDQALEEASQAVVRISNIFLQAEEEASGYFKENDESSAGGGHDSGEGGEHGAPGLGDLKEHPLIPGMETIGIVGDIADTIEGISKGLELEGVAEKSGLAGSIFKWAKISGSAINDIANPEYATVGQKAAAVVVDTAYELAKSAILKAIAAGIAGTAAVGTVTAAVAQGLTGIGLATGIATALATTVVTGAVYAGTYFGLGKASDFVFHNLGTRDFLVEKLGGLFDKVVASSQGPATTASVASTA